ncbi:MAG: hypothetical protein FVQ81_08625 [Candidatus Glassbacteria bacterium]|nr:hypothetical protein [Candidatus Glassbacteria bacterium]
MRLSGLAGTFLALCLSLVIPSALSAAGHPRLYFSADDIPALKAQAAGQKLSQYRRLRYWGDLHLDSAPPAEIGVSERHHETAFSTITAYGLLYNITGEEKYLAAGMRWIEALLETPAESGGNYHIGVFAASLGHGYDLFYAGLPPLFRERVKSKTVEILLEARAGADNAWWGGIYTHHDFWIPVAGIGIAALSIRDEWDGADSLVAFAETELGKAIDLLGENGYWPEGAADWVYGLAPSLMFFDCLARAGGRDFYEHPWLRNTARFRLAHWMPDDSYMFIGDSYRSGRYGTLGSVSAHVLMRLAARYRDSHAQWLALREARLDSSAPDELSWEAPYAFGDMRPLAEREVHGLPWQFLWYDPTVTPSPPDTLPSRTLYPNWDSAILRAGWSEGDPVLFFAGGHMLGRAATAAWKAGNTRLPGGMAHVHANAGSLYLWADGAFPLCPPGYGGRDGRFHSTVMIDGHGQRFDPAYRVDLQHYEQGENYVYLAAELSGAYPETLGLDRFYRQVVFLPPRTVLIVDRLATTGGTRRYVRRYEWLLHTDPTVADWQLSGDTIASVHRETGRTLLSVTVSVSFRYFWERQSMDRPDGRPMVRALSATMIGRVPNEVEYAAALHAPDEGGGKEVRVRFYRNEADTRTHIQGVEPEGRASAVIFASRDTVAWHNDYLSGYQSMIVTGLEPGRTYGLGRIRKGSMDLLPDENGQHRASEAGLLVIRRKK